MVRCAHLLLHFKKRIVRSEHWRGCEGSYECTAQERTPATQPSDSHLDVMHSRHVMPCTHQRSIIACICSFLSEFTLLQP